MEKQVCKIVYDKKENSSLRKQELFFIQLGSTINELKESIQFNEEHISDLKLENKKLQQDVCELQKQLLYKETYSRRENAKFVGLLEEQVDNISGGDEDHNGAQAQIEDTRGIV